MAHQVLEVHNSLLTTQTTNRVPQNC